MKLTENEKARLEALRSYSILDTPEEQEFEALVKLASQICGTSISQINFLDDERQWNKASVPPTPKEMKRGETFCSETIHKDEWMVVEDAMKDQRFNDLPYVKNDPNIKFYAGVNLKSKDGYNIGTICVLGFESKELEEWQLESLKTLAQEVEARLELRKKKNQLEKKTGELERQTTFLENATDLIFMLNPDNYNITDINSNLEDILGYKSEEITGRSFNSFADSEELKQQLDTWLQDSSQVFTGEFKFLSQNGQPVWLELHMTEKKNELYATAKNITQRKLQEKKIEESLEEKNILLAEIHHRVKNNLAVVSGMIQLQAFEEEDQKLKNKLVDSITRIQSMANIHEQLYQSNSFSKLKFSEHLQTLAQSIIDTIQVETQINLNFSLHPIFLNVNQAIPCSLIVNEVITNILKHAFDGEETGHINIELTERNGQIKLSVKDNGENLPASFKTDENKNLGLQIIDVLSKQLDAQYNYDSIDNGSVFTLQFEEKSDAKGIGSSLIQ